MNKEVVHQGTNIWAIYTVVMLIGKITGIFNVSWFWVFMPQLVVVGLLLIMFLILGILVFFKDR